MQATRIPPSRPAYIGSTTIQPLPAASGPPSCHADRVSNVVSRKSCICIASSTLPPLRMRTRVTVHSGNNTASAANITHRPCAEKLDSVTDSAIGPHRTNTSAQPFKVRMRRSSVGFAQRGSSADMPLFRNLCRNAFMYRGALQQGAGS
jgi:hypothetical protein